MAKLFCKKEMITRFLYANDFFKNNKTTASCQTSITPKHYIRRSTKRMNFENLLGSLSLVAVSIV